MTLEDFVTHALRAAVAAGARAADAVAVESDGSGVSVRLGEIEKVSEARERRIGLRAFVDRSSAVLSTADLSPRSVERLAEDAVACAKVTAPDPAAGLPAPGEVCPTPPPDLGLYDSSGEQLSTAARIDLAKRAEAAALGADPAISNSEGAEFSSGAARVAYGNTLGFLGAYEGSSFSLHVVPVANRDGGMQRDYWYTAARRFDRLEAAESVGRTAARRTLRRLGARKVATCRVPIVFDPEAAATLVRHLAAAVSGSAIYRGTSFLRDKLGEAIAAPELSVHDDGTMPGALGSRPFDGEGLPTRKTVVVDRGVLRSYLLDCYSARKLGLKSTGNAARSIGEAPSVAPTNLFVLPGAHTPEQIIASVPRGLYVTELIGFGINPVTGDYSRGAVGLWIEGGEFAHPVEEVTIAGNLLEMYGAIDMLGNDLTFRGSISAPTLRIASMTVAGA
jgi:PmbA protein